MKCANWYLNLCTHRNESHRAPLALWDDTDDLHACHALSRVKPDHAPLGAFSGV